ncbi:MULTISPECIES: LysR family transcriptional regulator [unclassified Luteibacter]|uniref:LysR family transcriptional regulator n=1 Tax=unclassified Luteibacter TaxID=2620188 RepID=UPI0008D274A9|nr:MULTISPECIES: LysR family transcriptional regulator [unclassified Luteibacter]MDR6935928.1 DNA-binding transcriptional LysR family regulator [Luteibacter sp. 3190]SEV90431.1 DNA-binding transcriptional regulator, LysR family [Luteibacter sp. 329MFSha]
MDRLLAMRVFTRLVDTGGFGKAADALRLPKSTVTKMIQTLESELGVRLLERTTRRISVTAEGAAYYEHTRRMLADLDDFESDLAGGGNSPIGPLRVETGGSVAARLLIPALGEFRERFPGIELQIGVSDRTVDLLSEGVDCAIRSTGDDPAVVARQIAELPWALTATPAYLARQGMPETLSDLKDHAMVGYFSARTGRSQPLRLSDPSGAVHTVDIARALEVNESNAHSAAALAGLGLVQTLRFQVADALDDGRLVDVMPTWQPPPLPVYLVYLPTRRHNPRLRAFVEWVAQALPARAGASPIT